MSSPSPVTQKNIDAVANLKVAIYIDGLFIGISDAGEHPLEINTSATPTGSALSGENGAWLSVSQGGHIMFTPTIQGLDKNVLNKIDPRMFTAEEVGQALVPTNPFAGRVTLESNPDIVDTYPLVIKPFFVEKSTGTNWGTEVGNPLTILLSRAAHVESISVPNATGEIVKIQYTFRGHVDLLNDNRFALMGPGIDTDGTIT